MSDILLIHNEYEHKIYYFPSILFPNSPDND